MLSFFCSFLNGAGAWVYGFAFLLIYFLVPDLESVKYKVLSRGDQYEIREVEVYTLFIKTFGFVILICLI